MCPLHITDVLLLFDLNVPRRRLKMDDMGKVQMKRSVTLSLQNNAVMVLPLLFSGLMARALQ